MSDYSPPKAVQSEAKRALQWIEDGYAGSGFTDTGRKRAADLARGASVSRETIGRIANYLARHEGDKKGEGWSPGEKGYPSPGRVAWAAWGGDPAKSWTASILESDDGEMNDSASFKIVNKAADAAEVLIYEDILPASAGPFVRQLRALDADRITVRINSGGGNVFDAIAMANALRDHPASVTTVVDGLAASAASFIATAGDEVVMNRNSELMIHNPKAVMAGGASEMRSIADRLDAVRDNIASMYAAKAGGTVEQWRDLMSAETWYSAEEAVQAGLADRVSEQPAVTNKHDLSAFMYAGRAVAPEPHIFQPITSSAPVENTSREDGNKMPTLSEGLAELFGVPADADDETILAAAKEALDERVEVEIAPAEPTIEQAAAIAAQHNLTLVDSATLASLQDQAKAGAEARAVQVRESHERIVDSAISDGRVAPASRDHWLAQLAADSEGIANVIAALPAVIPVTEVGHAISNEADDDDSLYSRLFGATVKDTTNA